MVWSKNNVKCILISKLLNVYTETKNDIRHLIVHILHIDAGDRGVAVAIYQLFFVMNLTMACLYLETLMTLK